MLTATPLQNSLLELYGLARIIDDFAFGDLQSYRSRFTRLGNDTDFAELKERLAPLCKRTLRRQVLAPTLPEKLERQREARLLEGKRDEAWRAFDQASREIDHQKDTLLDVIGQRLTQTREEEPLFTSGWRLA